MSLFYYINNTERTSDVQANTLSIQNQIQQRVDSCVFKIFQNTKPTENQDLRIYDGGNVSSHSGVTIVLKDTYELDVNAFRAGQTIFLKIGDSAQEKAEVLTYTESTRTIVLTASPTVSMVADDEVGELIFGGTVSRVKDQNVRSLTNLEFLITGTDYTKIFDKKDVSDTWEDVDARYIINDFVNTTVNFNNTLDNIAYANDAAIQAEWIEADDGNNPTVDTSDFLEAEAAGVFGWTFVGGTATWTATPTTKDLEELVGVASGTPTKGAVMGWFKTSDQSKITSLKIQIGSATGAHAEVTIPLTSSTDWQYHSIDLDTAAITGTPDWTAIDHAEMNIVQTGNGTVSWNGLRVNAEGSFTLFNVQPSVPDFDDFRSPHTKPMALMNTLAKTFEFVWYIDYERDIHFAPSSNDPAPFALTDTSDNFFDLEVECDVSNLGNRIKVFGGEKTSISTYAQVFEGDSAVREWILKTKFKNLVLTIDDNTSTDTMEGGTTTTTVVATTHGLVVGDHIVNRSQANEVRAVLTVPGANSFTVEAVTGQVSGDTFSKFDTTKTDGVEGISDETLFDYVANSNEKSVRATASEATLDPGDFIRAEYNERVPIQIQYLDSASANTLKALGIGDGVFDLDNVVDRNIEDTTSAQAIAQARVREFGNAVITGTFTTDQKGLRASQLLQITQTANRLLNDTFVIQKISIKQTQGAFNDYLTFKVSFGTTIFGWIEFMQKLLRTKEGLEQNVNDVVETFVTAEEDVDVDDTNQIATDGGFLGPDEAEIVESADTNTISELTTPWRYEPNGVGQPLTTRYNLSEYT